jgi:hypothetical protein
VLNRIGHDSEQSYRSTGESPPKNTLWPETARAGQLSLPRGSHRSGRRFVRAPSQPE